MQNRKPHRQKAPQTGHSIFGTILFSLLAVLAVEILLLTFAAHATRLGPQLNQNAEDILAMQVDNRSRYLQSIFHDAQELTSLSDAINGLTQQLLDEGEISLSTLDSSSDAAYPLLEAAAPELISTLRIKSVTGVFLILNTHDLDKRKQDSRLPAIYLRDLDPDAAPSQRNADLTFVRAPAQLVQSLSIATDNSWSPTIRYRALGNRGFLYPPFQAAYKDGASLAASDYGHWTSQSYPMPGDTHEAIAYSQPLILPDGTVYGVIGVELLADYLWENLPCSELQNNGTYFLAVTGTEELSASELQLRPVLRSHCDGQPGSADESLTLRLHSAHTHRYLFSNALYIASVSPLEPLQPERPFLGRALASRGLRSRGAALCFRPAAAAAVLLHHADHAGRWHCLQLADQQAAGPARCQALGRGSRCRSGFLRHPASVRHRHPGAGSVLLCLYPAEQGRAGLLHPLFAHYEIGQCGAGRL